ncbi:MAG TPA: mandelate racemase/muconate lactonizing enzyme family protein [Bryobacterales bacterium]|jgi:galactonate dehydratase|nr:mandelate racemase/muconate lactonizing enzyme family protein [Bryobacterales bacterium]
MPHRLNRRQWIMGCASLALLRGAERPRLKITDMEVFVVKVNVRGNWIFVRLKTDLGLTGLGEASHGGGFQGEGDAQMPTQLAEYFGLVRGGSPFEIEAYRARGRARAKAGGRLAATAFSAIEQAQWDLAAKALGAPLYELFGGKLRSELDVYANINRATNEDRSPAGFAANASKAVEEGFRAIKAAPFDDFPKLDAPAGERQKFAELGIARVEAIRRAVGPHPNLLIDCHSHFDPALGIEVARRLEPQNLYWYEEPVPPERIEESAAIRSKISQRMAGGELLFGLEGFAPVCRRRSMDIIMPDVKHCGGILEALKISVLAEADGVLVAPHNPSGPVATAASVQLCAGLPNFLTLEYAWGEAPWRKDLIIPPEEFSNGKIRVSDRPGFGIELNERLAREHA